MKKNQGISRREVLARTAGVLAAAPFIIPASAIGRAADQPAASERVTLGQIGCGGRGGADMGGLTGVGGQLLAACDVYQDRRDNQAKRYGAQAYADFRELLARDDIDAVLIASPEHWHATMSIEACRRGKDVFCEKPLTYNIAEAKAVLAAAQRFDRVFQVGTQQRSDRNYRFACELVQNGYIGDVKSVWTTPGGTSQHCNLPAQDVPAGLDWNAWLGPAPWAPYHQDRCVDLWHWWNWRDYSGGLMTDRGAHDFDIVQWGLGMDGSGPVEVIPPDGKDVKTLTYIYANGVVHTADAAGWGGGGKPGAYVGFTGTKGKVGVWRGGIETEPANLANVTIGPNEKHLYESDHHERNFIECVKARKKPAADVSIGVSSMIVCHIGNIAYWVNRPLKWDPQKLEFPGDAEANAYRSRAMREPWRL